LISAGVPSAITFLLQHHDLSEMPKTCHVMFGEHERKPCSREMVRSSSTVSRLSNLDIPAVGSSSIRRRGRDAREMAISSRFWSPWERIDADNSCFSPAPLRKDRQRLGAMVRYRRDRPNGSRLFPW